MVPGLVPPYQDEVLTNIGIVYLRKKNSRQARSYFLEAGRLNPRNTVARDYLNKMEPGDKDRKKRIGTIRKKERREGSFAAGSIGLPFTLSLDPLLDPLQNRGQDLAGLAVKYQVGQIIVRGRVPVDNHQSGTAPFGRQRQGGGWLDHQGRAYDDKQVGGG